MVEKIGREEGRLLAKDELNRAEEEIKSARILHRNKLFFKSVVSAYYAVYHAAKSALLEIGVLPRTHEGVERMFSLYYVKNKKISTDIGKIIGRLMKLREEADYYPEIIFTDKDSEDAIKLAVSFIGEVKKALSKIKKTSK